MKQGVNLGHIRREIYPRSTWRVKAKKHTTLKNVPGKNACVYPKQMLEKTI